MKKKALLFGLIAVFAASTAVAFATSNNSKAEEVVAGEYNEKVPMQNGLFVKVTDVSSIQDGESLLVIGGGHNSFQFLVGASYHYWMTTEFSSFDTAFDNYIYASGEKAELVTFEKTADDDVFYLKLKHFVDYSSSYTGQVKSGYIVHEAYDNRGVTAFGDLFFREKKNKPSENASKWRLTYDNENGRMYVRSLSGRQLQWKSCSGYSWSSFIATPHTEWASNIDIYRKIDYSQEITISTNTPSVTNYYFGDTTDLTGLEISVKFKTDNITINSSYASHPSLFKALKVCFAPPTGCFEWCGLRGTFVANVQHDTRHWRYYYQSSSPKYTDLRGTYLLGLKWTNNDPEMQIGQEEEYTYVLDFSKFSGVNSDPGAVSRLYYNTNPFSDGYGEPNPEYDGMFPNVVNNVVKITLESQKFYIKTPETVNEEIVYNKYLGFGENGPFPTIENAGSDGLYDFSITVDNNNHIYTNNGQLMLVFDARRTVRYPDPNLPDLDLEELHAEQRTKMVFVPVSQVRYYHIPVELYRLEIRSNLPEAAELADYKAAFFANTQTFDPTGKTHSFSSSYWTTLKNAFNDLPIDVQGYLGSLTYEHGSEEDDTYEALADKYDSILNIYKNDDGFVDFMSRGLVGTLQAGRRVTFNGEHCNMSSSSTACYTSSYSATITPQANYNYPESVVIKMGDQSLSEASYTYNNETGALTILSGVIVDDIIIEAYSEHIYYTLTYVAKDNQGVEHYHEVHVASGAYTLVDFNDIGFTDFVVPAGREFFKYKIGNTVYAEGASYTVSEDTVIEAVYHSINPAIDEIESTISTTPYLSYDYEEDGGNYTLSNINIRFRTIIGQTLWNELDNVTRFGVLLTTEEHLSGGNLQNYFYLTKQGELEDRDPEIYNYYSTKDTPTLLTVAKYPDLLTEDSYSWNLRISLTDNVLKLTTKYVAVAYIETENDGVVLLGQVTASVKSIAANLLATDDYDENSLDGSLYYLAHLGE